MALSFRSVEKAYTVFNKLGVESIPAFPQDMQEWTEEERKFPKESTVYGFSKKDDGGWENIYFFIKNPSEDLLKKFDELKGVIHNSSMCHKYGRNPDYYIIGWF